MPARTQQHVMGGHRRLALRVALASLTGVLAIAPSSLAGQEVTIAGLVRDSSGAAVGGADVAIVARHLLARADTTGHFSIRRVEPGTVELSVRRIGYVPRTVELVLRPASVESVTVVLAENPTELPGMVVSEQEMRRRLSIEEFYRRRALGLTGHFLTRADIEARHPSRLSDALREIPGLQFTRSNMGGGMEIRFTNSSVYRRDCQPQYFVDGQRVAGARIDDFPARDVEGIEIYNGPAGTPMQFSQGAITTCGTIVIWSRIPGT